jgi:hypothetical protein
MIEIFFERALSKDQNIPDIKRKTKSVDTSGSLGKKYKVLKKSSLAADE